MTVLAIVDTALLVLALVYIVALLRSHADILRRLSILEETHGSSPTRTDPASVNPLPFAPDIAGITLAGDPVKLSLGAGSPVTLLAFLTSGCGSCGPLWAALRDPSQVQSLDARVLVITHDPSRESMTRLREIAPGRVEVIMASGAWADYEIPSSPHFVLSDGQGGISGRGSALSWPQLVAMVTEARTDTEGADTRSRTTGERAARAERELARSGIGPGHASLYPSATAPETRSAP
jgi:hypothetical protein